MAVFELYVMKTLVYTFRTNPFLPAIHDSFGDIFIFGNMKKDFECLKSELRERTPDLIVGIARSWNKFSYIECKALNRFNKSKTVEKGQPSELKLFMPSKIEEYFNVNRRGSDSFCNWAMYRVSNFVATEEFDTKHVFFHCHETDIPTILEIFCRIDLN